MKKAICLLLAILMLASLLCGCSKSSEECLLGDWKREENGRWYYTFYDDGTCEVHGEYGTCKWTIVNGSKLKITDYYGETSTYSLTSIDENKMVLGSTVYIKMD